MNEIPEEIKNWVEEVINSNILKASNEEAKKKVLYKKWHISQVVEMGMNIIENSPEFEWNRAQAMTICLLHDIGRFPQVLSNSYSDIQTGIDHAALGVKMIADKKFPWKNWHIQKNEVIEAIQWHNKKDYPGKNIYAKFIRDADKNALFIDFDSMEKVAHVENKPGKEINENVWKALEERRASDNKEIVTFAEDMINKATWFWNLNLPYSKKIAAKSGMAEKLIKSLEKNGNSKEEIERLKKNLDEFKLLAAAI
jgi:hypothetical protein